MTLTNSAFPFVNAGMRFLVGDEWRQLFDVVITSAQKPGFYSGDRPFRVYSSKSTPASQDFIGWRHAGLHDLKDGRVLCEYAPRTVSVPRPSREVLPARQAPSLVAGSGVVHIRCV